jgi:mannose-6-phosphate isomerase-like protein (cupin superfamily)
VERREVEARAGIQRRDVAYVGPGEGRAVWVPGGRLLTYKVTAEQTGGAYSLFEDTVPPQYGAPPHIHHREDESFYVVEGEFEFSRDGETIRAGAGSLVYVPRGSLHAFKNVGERSGRLLMSQTPGGLHERFFEEVGEEATDRTTPPAATGRPDLVAVAAKYGTEMPVSPGS